MVHRFHLTRIFSWKMQSRIVAALVPSSMICLMKEMWMKVLQFHPRGKVKINMAVPMIVCPAMMMMCMPKCVEMQEKQRVRITTSKLDAFFKDKMIILVSHITRIVLFPATILEGWIFWMGLAKC